MERAQEELALTQMRKSVEKSGSSTESYGDPTMMRFLDCKSNGPRKGRQEFCSNGGNGGLLLFARIIFLTLKCQMNWKLGRFAYKACPKMVFPKFVVHLLDKTLASSLKDGEIGKEKLIGILDLQHISYKNIEARALITGFQFLQAYYPERLAKFYLLHMPLFFVAVWKLVSRFLEKATLEKIVIVSNEEERLQFMREVGEDVLPEEYGGNSKFVALQDVVVNPLAVEG
nr:CRAL-TRIO domain-containing protein YKL091C [Ipomoea batatas]